MNANIICIYNTKNLLLTYTHNRITDCLALDECMISILSSQKTHTDTRLMALCPGLPRWAGTGKVKPIWILLKQETVSGSGISWAICKCAPCSRQTTTPAPHHSVFYRPEYCSTEYCANYSAPGRAVEYCDEHVCLYVCPHVCNCLWNHVSKLDQMYCTCCLWSWLGPLWRRCDTFHCIYFRFW